jgi:hypothetical protein
VKSAEIFRSRDRGVFEKLFRNAVLLYRLKANCLSILDGNSDKTQAFSSPALKSGRILTQIGEKKTVPKNRLL